MAKAKAALIAHPNTIGQVHHFVGINKDGYDNKPMKDEFLKKMIDWCPPCKLNDFELSSATDPSVSVDGFFMAANFFTDQILLERDKVLKKIKEALIASEEMGADIAVLGAFSSIADGKQGAVVSEVVKSMAVTNGTTMTSVLTIEGIEKIAGILGIELSDANLAIVGATGSIGGTCARYFIGKTRKLTLTGRNSLQLKEMFGNQAESHDNIVLTRDNNDAVKDADLVICATSTLTSIFEANAFKPGAAVCDVGFPKNIAEACADRTDIIVFSGGLAQIPGEIKDAVVWGVPADDILYGCLAEGLILGMTKNFHLCRVGLEEIPLENLSTLREIAIEHGFGLPPFFNDTKHYQEEDFNTVRQAREEAVCAL